jgi:hypothetical protein
MLKLRVHIVPVGFEIDRVIEPLVRLKADKVWLVIEENIEKTDAKYHYNKIKNRLNELKIECSERRCDTHSLFLLLNTYRMIIEDEQNHLIFINVSTGNKIEAIAGTMASMIFNNEKIEVKPYYVVPQNYEIKPRKGQPQLTSGYAGIIQLPNYKIERPAESLIAALKVIQHNNHVSKKILIEKFLENKLIVIEKSNHSESAKHSQLNSKYLEPLLQKGLITIQGKGKPARISITEDGENILKFLPK